MSKNPPLNALHPILRKQVLDSLRRYSAEERLLALILETMVRQLDPEDQRLPYVSKNLKQLRKINSASVYVRPIIDASNNIWKESFKELTIDVAIASFASSLIYKRQKQFKKIGVSNKDFAKLSRNHGIDGYTMASLKVVNLILEKIEQQTELLRSSSEGV